MAHRTMQNPGENSQLAASKLQTVKDNWFDSESDQEILENEFRTTENAKKDKSLSSTAKLLDTQKKATKSSKQSLCLEKDMNMKSLMDIALCGICNEMFKTPYEAELHYESPSHSQREYIWKARKTENKNIIAEKHLRGISYTFDFTKDDAIEEKLTNMMRRSWKKLADSNLASGESKTKKIDSWCLNAVKKQTLKEDFSTDDDEEMINGKEQIRQAISLKYYWLIVPFQDPKHLFIGSLHEEMQAFTNLAHCALCVKRLKSRKRAAKHFKTAQHQTKVDDWLESEISKLKDCDAATYNVFHKVPTEKLKLYVTNRFCVICFEILDSSAIAYAHYLGKSHVRKETQWLTSKTPEEGPVDETPVASGCGDVVQYQPETFEMEEPSSGCPWNNEETLVLIRSVLRMNDSLSIVEIVSIIFEAMITSSMFETCCRICGYNLEKPRNHYRSKGHKDAFLIWFTKAIDTIVTEFGSWRGDAVLTGFSDAYWIDEIIKMFETSNVCYMCGEWSNTSLRHSRKQHYNTLAHRGRAMKWRKLLEQQATGDKHDADEGCGDVVDWRLCYCQVCKMALDGTFQSNDNNSTKGHKGKLKTYCQTCRVQFETINRVTRHLDPRQSTSQGISKTEEHEISKNTIEMQCAENTTKNTAEIKVSADRQDVANIIPNFEHSAHIPDEVPDEDPNVLAEVLAKVENLKNNVAKSELAAELDKFVYTIYFSHKIPLNYAEEYLKMFTEIVEKLKERD